MRPTTIVAVASAAALSLAASFWVPVWAYDDANTSLKPSDAAGAWTLEKDGRALCVVKLGDSKAGAVGFALTAPASCGNFLPANVAAWTPAANGMNLVGADGQTLIGFSRWSNSLLVSHSSSGTDLQLRRGPS